MSDKGRGESTTRIHLVKPRDEVESAINATIEKGIAIRDRRITTREEWEDAKGKLAYWRNATAEYLRSAFDSPSIADNFEKSRRLVTVKTDPPLARQLEHFRTDINQQLNHLRGLLGRVGLMDVSDQSAVIVGSSQLTNTSDRKVFIVHGRDEGARDKLVAFLRKVGLDPIVLDEIPSAGRTIIEKFEQTASTVGYAVVLLTPDDAGALKDAGDQQDRARQNVIYELGYFAGKLGRGKVCLLQKGTIEIPSDLSGIVYVSLDKGDWQQRLASELKVAGMAIDPARLLNS